MEWGSVSDWISSLSSFGTLAVAYMAYKAVPDWINRKNIEDGSKIAQNFINNQVEEALFEINKTKSHLISLIKIANSRNAFLARKINNKKLLIFIYQC